jgi:hypothetical protein
MAFRSFRSQIHASISDKKPQTVFGGPSSGVMTAHQQRSFKGNTSYIGYQFDIVPLRAWKGCSASLIGKQVGNGADKALLKWTEGADCP